MFIYWIVLECRCVACGALCILFLSILRGDDLFCMVFFVQKGNDLVLWQILHPFFCVLLCKFVIWVFFLHFYFHVCKKVYKSYTFFVFSSFANFECFWLYFCLKRNGQFCTLTNLTFIFCLKFYCANLSIFVFFIVLFSCM